MEKVFLFELCNGLEKVQQSVVETTSFKPIKYYLDFFKEWTNCNIYCDDKLFFILRNYGNKTYVMRKHEDKDVLNCLLEDGKLFGHAFLYKDGDMQFILKYDNNNLHGNQLDLGKGINVIANHGQLESKNDNIWFAHEIVVALAKWW